MCLTEEIIHQRWKVGHSLPANISLKTNELAVGANSTSGCFTRDIITRNIGLLEFWWSGCESADRILGCHKAPSEQHPVTDWVKKNRPKNNKAAAEKRVSKGLLPLAWPRGHVYPRSLCWFVCVSLCVFVLSCVPWVWQLRHIRASPPPSLTKNPVHLASDSVSLCLFHSGLQQACYTYTSYK